MAQLFDDKNNHNLVATILPQSASADVNGAEVDTRGYNSATLQGFLDATAEGSFKLQDSDVSGSGFSDVSDDFVITASGANDTTGVASSVVTLGYVGTKRYLRGVFTHSVTGLISATIDLGRPYIAPTGTNS